MALGLSVKECQACAELEAHDAGDGRQRNNSTRLRQLPAG